jgi:hypothetical protein
MAETLTVPRMYTDDAGDSRFDSYEVKLSCATGSASRSSIGPPQWRRTTT